MGLSTQQMARLSELLDQALPMTPLHGVPGWQGCRARICRWCSRCAKHCRPTIRTWLPSVRSISRPRWTPVPAIPRPPNDHAGERLGAYELQRPLGAGGMAEVWLARRADGAFERRVALKIPRLSHVPVEMAERFARECRILATLEFPGIARLYDAGVEANRTPYIAMEYVQGEPLIAWCDSQGLDVRRAHRSVPAGSRRRWLRACARHRSPRPETFEHPGDRAGRSAPAGFWRGKPAAGRHGTAIADAYLRARADSRVCEPGAAARRAGRCPQRYLLPRRSAARAADGRAPRKRARRQYCRGALREVLAKALATSPADRYPDVAAFAAALRRASGDRAPLARPGRDT